MNIQKINSDTFIIFIIFSIIFVSYIFYILFGGFGSGDDINLVLRGMNVKLKEAIKFHLFEDTANISRPVSMILSDIIHYYFKSNTILYTTACFLTWILSIIFISLVLLEFCRKNTVYIFFLLGSFPFFATSIFSGPFLFANYFVSILFWSISLYLMIKYAKNKRNILYYCSLIFLILSLLSLEYIIPLLWLTAFLPIVYEIYFKKITKKNRFFKLCMTYVLPVIIISLLFLIFKTYIVKLYTNIEYIYGAAPINKKSFFQSLYYFFAVCIEVPLMLFEVVLHTLRFKLVIIALLIIVLFFVLLTNNDRKYFRTNRTTNYKTNKLFLVIIFLSLFSSSIIFFISSYPSSTFGYYNKMMVPCFISLSILVSIFFNHLISSRYFILPMIVSFLWISSMIVQLDNFNKSWELRKNIMSDISTNVKKIEIDDNTLIIANVPYFLKKNYNNEKVIFTTWGFGAHLKLIGVPNVKISPVCHRILIDPLFYPGHNIQNKLHKISDDMKIYYYEFEENKETSIFQYIGTKKNMLNKFEDITLNKINYHPIIFREKIRIYLKRLIQNKFNI